HFDRPPAGVPAPHLIRFPVWARHSVPSAEPTCDGSGRSEERRVGKEGDAVPTRVGAPAKPSARSVSKAVGNAMAAPFWLRAPYGIRLFRVTGLQTCALPISFRPSPGRSPRTSPDSFSRVGPPFCAECRANVRWLGEIGRASCRERGRCRTDSGWRSSEAQRPECVKSGGKCDGRPFLVACTVRHTTFPRDWTPDVCSPDFISTVPRQESPHLT